MTTSQGLCNIGEWHSHHRIDLPGPSEGDQTTVWKHVKSFSGGRFLLLIATIVGSAKNSRVNIGCFMFSSETKKMSEGLLVTLQGASPIRKQFDDKSFHAGPEESVSWMDFDAATKNDQTCVNLFGPRNTFLPSQQVNSNEEALGNDQANQQFPKNTKADKGKNYSKSLQTINNSEITKKDHKHKTRTVLDNDDKTRLIARDVAKYGSTNNYRESPKNERPKNKESRRGYWVVTKQPEHMLHSQRMQDVVSPSNVESEKPSMFDCCGFYIYNKRNDE